MKKESVAIILITYNSQNWILETLESLKSQTYKEIELIISDDNSKDKTLILCQEWLEVNSSIFNCVKILKSDLNQGVTKNINKGIRSAESNWIKLLAGDDILFEDCIDKNINYCIENNLENLFSKVVEFKNELKIDNIIYPEKKYDDFHETADNQFKRLVQTNFVAAPTGFFKKSLIENMNYFDEKYPMVEDYPMWLRMTSKGIKLNFLDEPTVYYRVHSSSLSNNLDTIINEKMYNFRKVLFEDYIKYKTGFWFYYSEKLSYLRYDDIIKKGNKNKFTLIAILTYLIDPYSYLKIFRKIWKRDNKR